MLTDDEARTLLQQAADTIEVGPGDPLPAGPPRSRWPLLVAAAVLLAIAATSFVLTRSDRNDPAPAAPSDGEPMEKPEVLDPDQIPSVLGYDLADAREVLESRGLVVDVRTQPESCVPPGIVTGTEPSLGARFEPGETVHVFLSVPTQAKVLCLTGTQQVWDLLRFARGVAGPPNLAEDLTLFVEGGDPTTITREQAADQASWTICKGGECHSALAAIEQMASKSWNDQRRPHVTYDFGSQQCEGDASPPSLQESHEVRMWVTVPIDGIDLCPQLSVVLYIDNNGALAGVGLDLPQEVPASDPVDPTEAQRAAAEAFVAWARGDQTPPPFEDDVDYLVSDEPWETLPSTDAAVRGRWSVGPECSGLSPEVCGLNPLRILADYEHHIVQSPTPASCGAPDPRRLPAHLADAVDEELVRLDQAEPKNCRVAFAIELWITDEGRIRAANFLP